MAGIVRCRGCGALNNYAGVREGKVPKCGACRVALDVSGRAQGVAEEALARAVEGSPVPVLLLVWDPSDRACRSVGTAVDRFAARRVGEQLALTVDVEVHPNFPATRAIETVPTLLLFRGGAEADRQASALGEDELERWIFPQPAETGRA